MERFLSTNSTKTTARIFNSCRLCGMDTNEKVKIFEDVLLIDEDDPPLDKKIEICIGMEVKYGDQLPKFCCVICSDKISDFFEFRLMCKMIEKETRKMLGLPPATPSQMVKLSEIPKKEELKMEPLELKSKPKIGPKSAMDRLKKKEIEEKKFSTKTALQKLVRTPITTLSIPLSASARVLIPSKQAAVPTTSKDPMPQLKPMSVQVEKLDANLVSITSSEPNTIPTQDLATLVESATLQLTDDCLKRKAEEAFGVTLKPLKVSMKKLKPSDYPKPKIKCSVCSESFKNDGERYSHLYNCHVPFSGFKYGCPSCAFPVTDKIEWQKHKLWHARVKELFSCLWCNETFKGINEHSKHFSSCPKRVQFEVTQHDIRCELCKRKFITRNLYEWHKCFIRNNGNCRKCGEFFKKKDKLFKHFLDCPLPFIEVPKPEPVDTYTRLFPDHAAKIAKKKTKTTERRTPLVTDQTTVTNLNEGELLIKSEDGEEAGDISSLLETNMYEPELENNGMDAISSLLDSVNAALEKISDSSKKKKKKKGKEKNKPAPPEKRIEPLKLRLKSDFNGHSTENSQGGNQDEDIAYIPQYEHFVDIGSDRGDSSDTEAAPQNSQPSVAVRIKQEKLNEAYGDTLPTPSVPLVPCSVVIKQERVTEHLNKTAQPVKKSARVRIKKEPTDKDFATIARQIKKEKGDRPAKASTASKNNKNFSALALRIKKEKGAEGSSRSKNIAINPLAAAKGKKLLKIPAKLALKIKKERANKKKPNPKPVRVKQERPDSDNEEESQAYLSLNPVSVASKRSSSLPTVQIPTSSTLLITNVESRAGEPDYFREGSVTPDLDEFLGDTTGPSPKSSPPKKTTTVPVSKRNGFLTPAQRKQGPSSILENNEEDYNGAINAAQEADDLLKRINEQLKGLI